LFTLVAVFWQVLFARYFTVLDTLWAVLRVLLFARYLAWGAAFVVLRKRWVKRAGVRRDGNRGFTFYVFDDLLALFSYRKVECCDGFVFAGFCIGVGDVAQVSKAYGLLLAVAEVEVDVS